MHSEKMEQFKCDICQGTFSSQSNLKRHTETMHIKDKHEFECNQCDKIFERLDNLHQHKRIEHNDQRKTIIIQGVNDKHEPFSCYICNKVDKDRNSVLRHIEQKHVKKSFCFNICFKVFSRKDTLQIHSQSHNYSIFKPKIICEICRQEFPGKLELRNHRLHTHKEKDE